MITASHNPPIFNGFKLKSHYGGSSDSETCRAVEGFLDKNPVQLRTPHSALRTSDVRPAHYAALKKLVDFKLIAGSKLRFAHDALFGVGAGCFEQLLAGTTCKVTTLNGRHDVLFGGINPEPIDKNYAPSQAFLRKHPHDICLVTDGDADRVGGMDGRGNYLTTHQIICLLLHHLVANRKQTGRVVKAITTTSMVDKMCAAYNLPLVETGVGFKYVCAEMLKGGVLLGVEESGGIGFPGHIPERDGIAAGLMLLELLATEKISVNQILAKLEKQFGPHRYGRIDTHYPMEKRAGADGIPENESAGETAALAAGRGEDLRRREICRAGFLVADAARFRHGAGAAHLRRGQIGCRRAKAAPARRFIDTVFENFHNARMINHGILNPQILSLLARVRHTNALVIADRGFPFWPMIETVDVSVVDDLPTVLQLIAAVRANHNFTQAFQAEEFLKTQSRPPSAGNSPPR